MNNKDILNLGFIKNDWTDNGVLIYDGFEKGNLLIQNKNNQFYVDGSDILIKDINHLALLDKAFNYK